MKACRRAMLAATAVISAVPASAAAPNGDVRCLMLSNLYAKVAAAAQGREAAAQSRLFYLGRVSGKLATAQLQAAMATAAPGIDPDKAGADMNKCLATLKASAAAAELAGSKAKGVVHAPQPGGAPVGR